MLRYITIIIAFFLSANLFAQTNVSGRILSNKDNTPVESASVYINGSSIGTASDKDGNFKLNRVTYPCLLVVSHVSYQLKTIRLDNTPTTPIEIMLNEKAQEINGLSLTGKSLRKENIANFKKYFLWGDSFAGMVKFLNTDGLYFSKRNDTIITPVCNLDYMAKALGKKSNWSKDSLSIINFYNKFSTKTTSQLIISIPEMGFKISMDIDYFDVKTSKENEKRFTINWNCYSHSIPIESVSENEKAVFESNRREAYFNSSRHFLRALFNNSLRENGYLIPKDIPDRKAIYYKSYSSTGEPYTVFSRWVTPDYKSFLDINLFLVQKSDNEIYIIGLKGKTFQILFFCNNINEPINLNNYKTFQWRYLREQNISYVNFQNDTCRIFNNGKSDGVTFLGKMGLKPVGTRILPDDYEPIKK